MRRLAAWSSRMRVLRAHGVPTHRWRLSSRSFSSEERKDPLPVRKMRKWEFEQLLREQRGELASDTSTPPPRKTTAVPRVSASDGKITMVDQSQDTEASADAQQAETDASAQLGRHSDDFKQVLAEMEAQDTSAFNDTSTPFRGEGAAIPWYHRWFLRHFDDREMPASAMRPAASDPAFRPARHSHRMARAGQTSGPSRQTGQLVAGWEAWRHPYFRWSWELRNPGAGQGEGQGEPAQAAAEKAHRRAENQEQHLDAGLRTKLSLLTTWLLITAAVVMYVLEDWEDMTGVPSRLQRLIWEDILNFGPGYYPGGPRWPGQDIISQAKRYKAGPMDSALAVAADPLMELSRGGGLIYEEDRIDASLAKHQAREEERAAAVEAEVRARVQARELLDMGARLQASHQSGELSDSLPVAPQSGAASGGAPGHAAAAPPHTQQQPTEQPPSRTANDAMEESALHALREMRQREQARSNHAVARWLRDQAPQLDGGVDTDSQGKRHPEESLVHFAYRRLFGSGN